MMIDPLYFLLLAEFAAVLLLLTIYFFINNRKNKDLYQKTLRKLNDLKSERGPETFERPSPDEASFPDLPAENLMEQQEPLHDIASMAQFESVQPDSGASEDAAEPGAVKRLQRMVNFQKSTIVELMCYKDVFEGARKRLSSLQQSNNELQEKIKGIMEGGVESAALEESVAVLEKNNKEMEKFISILDSENSTLSEKFQAWEEEFKRIAEDVEVRPESGAADDAKYDEMLQEKETMVARIKDFEEKLGEKSDLLSSMQTQYEDLEKEYMILYRQQQQQAAAQAQPE
ncbi:MAG: hypothetical protein HQL08_02630 [Nitrospirae bacterium]|nr:hypothetical protein [Nitrospirota bacterium]